MEKYKRVKHLEYIPLIIIAIILWKFLNNNDATTWILSIFSPIIGAFAIAYLLDPMVCYLIKHLKLRRGFSILITYIFLLGVIVSIVYLIIPNIISSISDLVVKTPDFIKYTEEFVSTRIVDIEFFDKIGFKPNFETFPKILEETGKIITSILNSFVSQLINLTSLFFKVILSITISVYMLLEKDKAKIQTKRLIYALFSKNKSEKIISTADEANRIFSKYIIGKTVDSVIIGLLCFFVLSIIEIPYALLISVIVGVTNMIPYFGPFIGAVPAVLITIFSSPIKALYVAITILVLQQFDGLYLGPKILGDTVGVRPLWIITAITLGGAAFGVMGMLLGVPVIAVLKLMIERYVEKRLIIKNIDIEQ